MKSPADSHEMTVLESKGILINDQIFHAVLTDKRIILTRYVDNKLSIRSIYFADIQKIEEDMDYSGDPVIILVTSYAKGKIKKVVLHFPQKNFPDHFKERSLWASEINKMLRSVSQVSPAPVLKKPPVTKAFCVKCGIKCTDGSAFCAKCGTKIIYPDQPIPSQEIDTSVIKRVKITEIPVRRFEQSQKAIPKEIPLSAPIVSDTMANVPATPYPQPQPAGKPSSLPESPSRKQLFYAIAVLVVIIVVIVAFFVSFSPGSTGFNLTFPGMNFTIPSSNGTTSSTSHVVTTPTIPKTTRTPVTPIQTRKLVRNTTNV
jgi:hypothetical protein